MIIPDHNADAYRSPHIVNQQSKSYADLVVQDYLFSGLNRWDSHYFVTIAKEGYQTEPVLAFFPFYPLCVRALSALIQFVTLEVLSDVSSIMVSSLILNTIAFIGSTVALFKLTMAVFDNNQELSKEACFWFCFNPASVFFTANYSESVFSLMTFSALYLNEQQDCLKGTIMASSLLGLSASTRSNGIISIGFMLHKQLRTIFQRCSTSGHLFSLAVEMVTSALLTLGPFIGYQLFSYYRLCALSSASSSSSRTVDIDWCSFPSSLPYSIIQNKYWNVGFLAYFRFTQAPNFLLASPIVYIVLMSSVDYLWQWRTLMPSLGLLPARTVHKRTKSETGRLKYNEKCFVYIVHILFLTVFGFFVIHVQVLTRLICSSSPVLYWIAASSSKSSRARTLFKVYFALYFLLGIFMHSNFLPWT
ncbi:GPI mannosyltransferase 2 [Halotydeus destructor]|nr:GPI mannosyltransferase 2 [Halotydeus destructor]